MGEITKSDGGVQLFHDCSLPEGQSVNDYCTSEWHQKFSRVNDAVALVTYSHYMQSAYSSFPISKHS